ncbi:hypothetical protein B0H19DRAFT_1250587 [Mycena capillaripes]|nr:hypothetical protein B0H19DRAFT_1250587 [Mycena capillaripes]
MFEVPQQPGSVVDGQDDDHPINLNASGIKDLDFRHLLVFLYDQVEIPDPTPLQFYFSVRHLSIMWRIQPGVKYVTTHLPSHPDFTPAMQIKLSRQYTLEDWAGPAFRTLIERPLTAITLADAEHMGVCASDLPLPGVLGAQRTMLSGRAQYPRRRYVSPHRCSHIPLPFL